MKIRSTYITALALFASLVWSVPAYAQQAEQVVATAPEEIRDDLETARQELNNRGISDEEQVNILDTIIRGSQREGGLRASDSAAIIDALPTNASEAQIANVINGAISSIERGEAGPEDFGVNSNGNVVLFGQTLSNEEFAQTIGQLPPGFNFNGFTLDEVVDFIRDPDVDVEYNGSGQFSIVAGGIGSIDICINFNGNCNASGGTPGGAENPAKTRGAYNTHVRAVPSESDYGNEPSRDEANAPGNVAGETGGNTGPTTAAQEQAGAISEAITTAAEDDMTSAEASIAAYTGSALVLESESFRNKKYMEFAFKPGLHDQAGSSGPEGSSDRYRSLSSVHLGVDKELLKRRMPIFQTLNKMGDGFLANEGLRDSYLDMYESVRSVALLTLNYLDKTVAAGLATVEQQKQMRVNNHLLKQMNWAVARLSDPSLSHIIDDNEEKITQCLAGSNAGDFTSSRYRLNFNLCNQECGTENPAETTEAAQTEVEGQPDLGVAAGPGLVQDRYDYCVCCAQVSTNPNLASSLVIEGGTGTADPNAFSVVDRLFLGSDNTAFVALPGSNDKDALRAEVIQVVKDFKETYGDIVITINDPLPADGIANRPANGTGEGMITKVVPPYYSPQGLVSIYRNGCVTNDQECSAEQEAKGICPAMFNIIRTWSRANADGQYDFIEIDPRGEEQLTGSQRARRIWFEVASRGGIPLTGGTINSFLELDSILSGGVSLPLSPTNDRNYNFRGNGYHRLDHYVNMFCDASAVAFAKRVHNRNSTIFLDALAINTAISPEHRAVLTSMVNRVHEYFSLADADLSSHFPVRKILMAMETEIERNRIADHSSFNTAIWNRGINTGFSNKVQGLLGDTGQ